MSYVSEVLADSPLVYYRLAGADRVLDSSGNSRTITEVGSNFTDVASLLASDSNHATLFDNETATGILNLDDSSPVDFPGTASFTLECWFKASTVDTTFRSLIGWTDENDSGTNSYGLVYQSATGFLGTRRVAGTTDSTGAQPAGNIQVGTTYYVVSTYNGSDLELWVDVISLDTSASAGSQGAYAGDLLVGGGQFGGSSMKGTLDEVAIYASVLSQARINAHFEAGRTDITLADDAPIGRLGRGAGW